MKDLSLFSTLDLSEREKIGMLAGKRVYRKHEIIFRDTDPAHTIYLIKYGRIRLFKVSEGGKEITLDILKADDIFGENTFFEENPRHTLSAQAMEDTFICSCSKEHFALLLQNPQTALKIIQFLGEKLNNYTNKVASIAFQDVKGRIAVMLLRLAEEYGKPSPEGTIIEINLTHQDIACLVNASRVMVTNTLGDFKQEGAIATRGHHFILLNPDKLASAAPAL